MIDAELKSTALDQMDRLETEILALRCITGLLGGQEGGSSINLSELTYLIDPIIEREQGILEKLRGLCHSLPDIAN